MESSLLFPPAYTVYVDLVKSSSLNKALKTSMKKFYKTAKKIREKHANYRYADDKWTIVQLLQHIIDAERVFVYRALTFSRNDQTELPGFDENAWADSTVHSTRSIKDLLKELVMVRQSTIAFFDSLTDEELARSGKANGNPMNVIGLGYVAAGHLVHHLNILNNRYLTELNK